VVLLLFLGSAGVIRSTAVGETSGMFLVQRTTKSYGGRFSSLRLGMVLRTLVRQLRAYADQKLNR
jgi:hypothetical protein